MRLIHLAEYTPEHAGSFVPFLRTVMTTARDRGWSVEVILPEEARGHDWLNELTDAEVPLRFLTGGSVSLTRQIRAILDESDETTLLHAHFTTYDTPTAVAVRGRSNVVLYWHIHTVLSESRTTIASNLVKLSVVARSVDRILCPSTNIAEGLIKRLGPESRISVFPSPIQIDLFPPVSEEERSGNREKLGIPPDASCLLTFARDWLLKGGDLFLGAVADLDRDGVSVRGLLNQGGDDGRAAVAESGLEGKVEVVGPVPDIRELFAAADVFVAPSRGEGMPFAVIEALCSGVPVIASDLPGHRFLADELEACLIVDREPAAIAAGIRSFLDRDPSEVREMCAEARFWIGQNLDLDVATNRLLDDYELTLSARGLSRS